MLTAEAHIQTGDASRYLVHLCQHAKKFNHKLRHLHAGHARPELLGVEWSDTHGTLNLNWGRCIMEASPNTLTLRVEASTEEHLRQIQDIVASDLERFGRRDNLTVDWR